ncbi:MAG: amidohydrolase family protein [Acetobacteraceae bacterium]
MIQGLVDTHCHAISDDPGRHPLDPIGGRQSDWSATRPATHQQLIAAMDAAGVPQAVVVQASTAYGHDNRYTVESVAAHPGRLAGVFSIDPLDPDSPRWIRHWHGQGLSGFRLFTTGTTMPGQQGWLDDPRCDAAWATAQALRLPICLQMTAKGIPAVRNMIAKFPGVTVVLDHLARPDLSDGPPYARAADLFALAALPQVVLKLTSRALDLAAEGRSTPGALVAAIVDAFGAGRIMWGSNFPAAEPPLPELVAQVQGAIAGLPGADQAMILGGTARRLYPALERVPA